MKAKGLFYHLFNLQFSSVFSRKYSPQILFEADVVYGLK